MWWPAGRGYAVWCWRSADLWGEKIKLRCFEWSTAMWAVKTYTRLARFLRMLMAKVWPAPYLQTVSLPLLPVMTGTLRGRERQSKMIGFCTHGMRKCVPSSPTVSWTPLNRSNMTARCPASTEATWGVSLSAIFTTVLCTMSKKKQSKLLPVSQIRKLLNYQSNIKHFVTLPCYMSYILYRILLQTLQQNKTINCITWIE